ncbi:MAG TPA: hypothetical protein VLA42_07890 [Verrucomicrobiae bacterium]|nr:hypothetical protein [Verrucomicrobiae bacterium]
MSHEPSRMVVGDSVAPGNKDFSAPVASAKVPLLQQLFSFPAMLASCLVTAVFVARHNFEVDPDLWWHLKVGEDILSTHHWPTVDPYSFTVAGQPWLAYEWLGDVLIASVARVAGLRGLQALLIVLGAAIMLALYSYATLRSKNSKGSFVAVSVLLALACANFNLRPQMLGYLFLLLTLIALERFRQGKKTALWFLPPLFLLWINAHGSWEIGLAAILAYWLCGLRGFQLGDIVVHAWSPEERTRLSLIFLLCLTVIPITPYGTRLAAYPFQVASSLPLNLANIEEWRPIALNSPGPQLFLFLVLGTIFAQVAAPMRWRLEDVLLFVGAAGMTFVHARFLLLFVPFFSPVFATMLSRWVPKYQREKDHYVLNVLLMVLMLGGMIHYFPSNAQIEKKIDAGFPVGAVRYLKDHPVTGPMYNSYDFGGYLVYTEPDVPKVFIDGRGELYEHGGVFADYVHVAELQPGVLGVLNNYGIRFCMVRSGDPLTVFLTARPNWKQVYSDGVSVIVVRNDSSARRQGFRDQ